MTCQNFDMQKGVTCGKKATKKVRHKTTGKSVNLCDRHAEEWLSVDGSYEEVKE